MMCYKQAQVSALSVSVNPGISGTHFDTSYITLILTIIRAINAALFIHSILNPRGLLLINFMMRIIRPLNCTVLISVNAPGC